MKSVVFVILPNQLFQNISEIKKSNPDIIVLHEHPTYFTLYKFHKLKIIFHRSSMKKYEEFLKSKFAKIPVLYVNYNDSFTKAIPRKTFSITMFDPTDHSVKSYNRYSLSLLPSPAFLLNTVDELNTAAEHAMISSSRSTDRKRYRHDKFYKFMREKFKVYLDPDGTPSGGKWSFDSENRSPFPKSLKLIPDNLPPRHRKSEVVSEAQIYTDSQFSGNIGTSENASRILPPITHSAAKRYFKKFLSDYFQCFGEFQDAVSGETVYGCHSNISSSLNSGLLTPAWVVSEAEKFARKHAISESSAEGFLRQVLGWREYCHMLYVIEFDRFDGVARDRVSGNKLDQAVWYPEALSDASDNTTMIPIIDSLISKAVEYSYLHHIERLMYIGNYMTLSNVNPKEVHDWFISVVSLDAYHWVMYPNVFGMAVQSPETYGLMMNREYFSSSNYIVRMSDAKKGDWEAIWNSLYYYYIWSNSQRLGKNYAIAAQVKRWKEKSPGEKKKILRIARRYLSV